MNGGIIKMKTPEPELYPPWKQLEKIASGWEYGSKHIHDEILQILGISEVGNKYYQQVERANKELTLIGKRLENCQGFGYEVVKPEEYVSVSLKYKQRSVRRLRTALEVIRSTPTQLLPANERVRAEQMLSGTIGLYQMAMKDQKKSIQITNAKPSDPRFAPKQDRKMITDEVN